MHSPVDDSKKRRRGAVRLSCAECRRLKLRCDRTVPCSSCVKRGCSAICPDGSLTTGQGNRFVLASTQELHIKINDLCHRVRALEDGLRSAHSVVSDEPHPLLADELLRIKHPLQRDSGPVNAPSPSEEKAEPQDSNIVDAVGSLSVSEAGRTKYFGHSANSWYFLHNEDPEAGDADDRWPALREILTPEILSMTGTFPMTLLSSPASAPKAIFDTLYWYLPPATRALKLRDAYYEYAAWMYNCIPRDQFMEEIYAPFYQGNPQSLEDGLLGHRLAVLFMILAIGSQVDQNLPPHNMDAEKYHQLARASLFGSSIVDQPTTRAVQALYLMVFYQFLEDPYTSTSNARWATMGMAVKLAQSIGLHRDSGKFNLDLTETERRRHLFLELYVYDSWMALTLGRPPSISASHYDIKPEPAIPGSPNIVATEYHRWKFSFTSECMTLLHDQAFGAVMPSYGTTMSLDRKLRAHPVPPVLQIAGFGTEAVPDQVPETPALTLQRHTVVLIRESNLLYLHRSFFARAVTDHPEDPLGSPFGTSVIAAYRSAWSLIALVRNLHATLRHPTERMWFVWANLFSGVIILGSLVTRCPSLTLAPSALVQLDSACELFAKVAPGFRAEKVLAVMLNLREKAHISLNNYRQGHAGAALQAPNGPISPIGDNVDELSTLGGRTRVVTRYESLSPPSGPSPSAGPSTSNGGPLAGPAVSPSTATRVVPVPLYDSSQNVHPSVLEYMRTFAPAQQNGFQLQMPAQVQQAQQQQQQVAAQQAQHSPTAHRQSSGEFDFNAAQSLGYSSAAAAGAAAGFIDPSAVGAAAMNGYTQFFPVFDYGPAGGEAAFPPLAQSGLAQGELALAPSADGRSESPHSTWNAFVAGLGM